MPMSRTPRSFWLGSSTSPPLMTRSNLSFGPIAAWTALESSSADTPATKCRLDRFCMASLPFGLRLAYHRAVRPVLALLACVLTLEASAQAFPSKPIRLVVGYPPGGSGDFTTRVIGDELAKELGVAVVVENRPGAGGNIAAELVAKSAPDGYTLLNGNNHAINLTLYKKTGYEDGDFAPITKVAAGPTIIVVNKDSPFRT